MNKDEALNALSKRLPEITDKELVGLLSIPETFYPTNPFNYTEKLLADEQARRAAVNKITFEQVLDDVVYLSVLRHLISFGPRVFPELDLLGIDEVTAEIRKLEPKIRKKITQYKKENNMQ